MPVKDPTEGRLIVWMTVSAIAHAAFLLLCSISLADREMPVISGENAKEAVLPEAGSSLSKPVPESAIFVCAISGTADSREKAGSDLSGNGVNSVEEILSSTAKIESGLSLGKISYRDIVLKRIKRYKYYPQLARDRGLEGEVEILFRLKRDGSLEGRASILKSTPYAVLNRAALRTLISAMPFAEFPGEVKEDELIFRIRLDYRL